MFSDPLYWLVIIGTGALTMWAQWRVKGSFAKWSKVPTRARRTGAEVAQEILERSGIFNVKVERVAGFLSDHYDPRSRTLRLSPPVYDSTSVAAVGVAAHEVGHALQHAKNYFPLQIRSFLAPAASFTSNIGIFIVIGGMVLGFMGLAKIGVVVMAVSVAFVLITLPVEFDASNRAKHLLPALGLTDGEEGKGVRSVLGAAAMTYVAAAVAAVAQLLYFALRAGLFGRD